MTKRVTSFDVAKLAGVSRSVVSAVLNGTPGIGVSEEKREAVLKAIQELNYQVDAQARGMKTGRSHCIAAYGNVSNPMFLQVLEGMQGACAAHGYHVLLYPSSKEPQHTIDGLLDLYLQRRIDGIVALDRPHQANEAWIRQLVKHRLPYVSVEGYPHHEEVPSVLMDYQESIRRALDFLWGNVGLPPVYVEMHHGAHTLGWGDQQRREAYELWMKEHGLQPRIAAASADLSWEEGAEHWKRCIQEWGLPTAVLTNWSRGAVYVSRAAQMMGVPVGEQLHVMAADNTKRIHEYLYPSITSMEVPYREMGSAAAERLVEYIEGRRPYEDKSTQWLPAILAVRQSVATVSS
ncbi:LacI family DNA-binding transcriptional regulator [Paenibacillus rigui]|uniref:LacI family transcriptional regulator n=1 Tax=Paenibacillus rigui TaxID=554312 RepID=A0A229ULG9_9BACL|nr:LacI family DNA-binding transcriptional regulator [Paenibacillus rigui]OXM84222.1 LacI family transcriptional regulator [Paenibacillus rigui]